VSRPDGHATGALALHATYPGGVEATYILRPGRRTIGAHPDCDVVLPIPEVSRRHARIVIAGAATIEDLGSKNGTFLNGRRIDAPLPLNRGDTLRIGTIELRVGLLDEEDVQLAIGGIGGPRGAYPDPGSTAAAAGDLDRWLRTIVLLSSPTMRPHSPREQLKLLMEGLSAAGVALISKDSETPTVTATVGAFDLGTLTPLLEGDAPTAAGEQGMVIASSRGSLILAAAFESAPPTGARSVLEIASGLVSDREPLQEQKATSGKRELQLPGNHVRGGSRAMNALYAEIRQLSRGTLPVLITGETGTGKEHVARALHLSSSRAAEPFAAINCTAIPSELLEAELFGIREGVATGVRARTGAMERAGKGTVFLDEIGDMPLALQGKLLRVLQESEVHPVGADRAVPLRARVLTATNRTVDELLGNGSFRRDLYFRVAGCVLEVPSLRSRRRDIPELVAVFARRAAEEIGVFLGGVSVAALEEIVADPWPGNVRELEQCVRHLVYLCPPGQPIGVDLVRRVRPQRSLVDPESIEGAEDLTLARHVECLERRLIQAALDRTSGNQTRAAALLGISRQGLAMKMERLGISANDVN